MSTNLASAFKAGLDGFDEDDDEAGLTELEKFSPTRVDGVADPASGFPILLLKSLGAAPAPRPAVSRPLPDLGEAWRAERARAKSLRKTAKARSVAQKVLDRQVDRVLAELIVEQTSALRARVADARRRIEWLEKRRGIARNNNTEVLTKGIGSVDEVAEALGQARKRTAAGGVAKAKAGGGKLRCGSCGKRSKSLNVDRPPKFCTKCGESLAKGGVAKSAGPGFEVLSLAEKQRLLRVVEKATGSSDPDRRLAGVGELVGALGPEVAVKVLENAPLSPAEFTRAFLANGRAPLSAPAGSSPRIPDMSHVISGDDFRRPALDAGHQRPNPLSPLERLQQAGQMGVYPPGAGVPAGDRYVTSPTSTTLAPGLARTLQVFGNAPAPGDARPW